MTPAEFELAQEQAEAAYKRGQISAMEFRKRMYALGFSPQACDDILDVLDITRSQAKTEHVHDDKLP